jgi:hypothetical protein
VRGGRSTALSGTEGHQRVLPAQMVLRAGLAAIFLTMLLILGVWPATVTPARADVCLPREPPYCVNTDNLLSVLDVLDEPVADVGDVPDAWLPDYEACWELATNGANKDYDVAYDGADNAYRLVYETVFGRPAPGSAASSSARSSSASSSSTSASSCGGGATGTTYYFPKGHMTSGDVAAGNFNHKVGLWIYVYRCGGQGCGYPHYFQTWLTTHSGREIGGHHFSGSGPGSIGGNFSRVASRPLCEYSWGGFAPSPSPTLTCFYNYR